MPFLLEALGQNRRTVKNLLKFGAVAVQGVVVRQFDHPLVIGEEVQVSAARTAIATEKLKHAGIAVVYEDDALIIVDKPVGLLTVATANEKTDTLYVRLDRYLQGPAGAKGTSSGPRAHVVHRLDKETSGLVVFAKTEPARRALQRAWSGVEKIYLAAVIGAPDPPAGKITTFLTESKALKVYSANSATDEGRLATTHYRLLQTRGAFSLVEVRLETGRKHQIRVHLAELGCPVAGDTRYDASLDPCDRLALHAARLACLHPITGEPLRCESPLPAAIARLFPKSHAPKSTS
jgi:23S rRNA pseudouridine1911/1915/1917 synthase